MTTAAGQQDWNAPSSTLIATSPARPQMYEGLIDFIEQSLFSVINQIILRREPGLK